jgi:hypothetical protein
MAKLASAVWQDASVLVVLALHADAPPSDAEWGHFCSWIPRHMGHPNGVSMVLTDGGAPSSAQREQMRKHLGPVTPLTAVITDKPVVRGVVTAVRWFNPKISAFTPLEFLDAFKFIGLSGAQVSSVCEMLNTLEMELSPRSRVLAEILKQLYNPIS